MDLQDSVSHVGGPPHPGGSLGHLFLMMTVNLVTVQGHPRHRYIILRSKTGLYLFDEREVGRIVLLSSSPPIFPTSRSYLFEQNSLKMLITNNQLFLVISIPRFRGWVPQILVPCIHSINRIEKNSTNRRNALLVTITIEWHFQEILLKKVKSCHGP